MLDQLGGAATSAAGPLLGVIHIPVGDHITTTVGGLTFNLDTIYTTAIAAVVVIGMGLLLRRRATSGVPGRLQMFWETIVGFVEDQVATNLGPEYRQVVPLGVSVFVFILIANWIEILPGLFRDTDYLPSPTADVNLTYALGIAVMIGAWTSGIRRNGARTFFRHIFHPPWILVPINIIEELVKPFTLALRLFGNLFGGGIMIALILGLFPPFASWIFTVPWKLFDMFIGVIQAFIFALLTVIYYRFALYGTSTEGGH
ncbi:MAG: F0F1 ATP synthase subunit A [Acidimicrobiales bacterium]|nr:F0F1 ATP synthase subunit A [Acidimicrobiales bacterium]MBO0886681.1 F0F1 ATP synthase subunit A [Acidimicrobiales bacterium]